MDRGRAHRLWGNDGPSPAWIVPCGLPEELVLDNGPEFIGRALDQWAQGRSIRLHFIAPGKPVQNAHIESFHSRFRDEGLNAAWFVAPVDARL